ncbi:MAG: quinone-interacting membrane-bound oxidoreductase complex subunit QmoC [Deltaproteobacteria bacterium]|nr:quinone-interacting membrane-bound oxidoreductase complex subunit QmoC [Deltaproteobacteria bacterium]
MAKELVAEPDLKFIQDLIAAGAGDLKKCYQCATCSVACRIAPDNNPYPRKEMIWAQWGLKDRLLNDPDVWMCHQCNDCSTQCPRGANPGDVLKAVRKMAIQENSWPSFLGKLVGTPALFAPAIGIPVLVVLLLVFINQGFSFPQPLNYGKFINYVYIQLIFTAALIFAVVSMVLSLKKYWVSLENNNVVGATGERRSFVPSLIEALKEILPHTTFKECQANNMRYTSHLLVFWGMIGLFVTTAIVAFNIDILHIAPPSQNGPGTLPIKILGNASAVSFVLGLGIMLVRRLTAADQTGGSSYFDWFFIFVIFGTGLTGLLTELIRWAGSPAGAYVLYTIHLMFVLALLLYLPFCKFAHLGYRTLAITWAKSSGRNLKFPVQPNFVASGVQDQN